VVIRVHADVRNLRRKQVLRAFAHATRRIADRARRFRVVHMSLQRNHVHLLVEAEGRMRLARGMQALQIAAARRINRLMNRRGAVFVDRYHATPITSPRQAHHALAYVLNNWRRHGEHLSKELSGRRLDPFATGHCFDGWAGRVPGDAGEPDLTVRQPQTWLLGQGWRRHGRLNCWHRPGPLTRTAA
jgi:REP element-mobilizing transposase RayT